MRMSEDGSGAKVARSDSRSNETIDEVTAHSMRYATHDAVPVEEDRFIYEIDIQF